MFWVVETFPKGRKRQQRASKLHGRRLSPRELWVRALRSVQPQGPSPSRRPHLPTSASSWPLPPLPLAHTSPQEMRTTWGDHCRGSQRDLTTGGATLEHTHSWAVPLLFQPQFLHLTRPRPALRAENSLGFGFVWGCCLTSTCTVTPSVTRHTCLNEVTLCALFGLDAWPSFCTFPFL